MREYLAVLNRPLHCQYPTLAYGFIAHVSEFVVTAYHHAHVSGATCRDANDSQLIYQPGLIIMTRANDGELGQYRRRRGKLHEVRHLQRILP